jgi:hypothetical protein
MTSEIKADKWSPASGTAGTIGDSGDTFTVPSGVTLNTSSATLTLPSTVISGQTAITSLADTDKFLVSDASDSGNLKYVEKQYLPSGGLVHITSQAFPAANNFTIDSVFSADYVNYIMTINMLNCSTDDTLDFVFVKSGTPDTGSNYRFTNKGYQNDGNSTDNYSNGTTTYGSLLYNMDADSEAGASGTFTIYSPFAAYQRKAVMGVSAVPKGTANNLTPFYTASDYHNGTTQQFTGIKFQSRIGHNFRAGSVAGGYSTVSIYGVKNS